jgi:hypothetical protein
MPARERYCAKAEQHILMALKLIPSFGKTPLIVQ